jgi:hypothetical protein
MCIMTIYQGKIRCSCLCNIGSVMMATLRSQNMQERQNYFCAVAGNKTCMNLFYYSYWIKLHAYVSFAVCNMDKVRNNAAMPLCSGR